jgi:hypothetical protein
MEQIGTSELPEDERGAAFRGTADAYGVMQHVDQLEDLRRRHGLG